MSMEDFTPGWTPIHVGFEGAELSIGGINPWRHANAWRRVRQEDIVVPHPSYPHQRHRASVYELAWNGTTTRFAVTELSNGVYGFYVPTPFAAPPTSYPSA